MKQKYLKNTAEPMTFRPTKEQLAFFQSRSVNRSSFIREAIDRLICELVKGASHEAK